MSLYGPTWAQIAGNPELIESRDVKGYVCPFCDRPHRPRQRQGFTGFRCFCGAAFHTQQAVACHFKERQKR